MVGALIFILALASRFQLHLGAGLRGRHVLGTARQTSDHSFRAQMCSYEDDTHTQAHDIIQAENLSRVKERMAKLALLGLAAT